MQTKNTYVISETGKNMVFIIKRTTDEHGRLLFYKIVEQFRKFSMSEKYHNEDSIQAYVLSLNAKF